MTPTQEVSWSRPDPDLPDFKKSRKPDLHFFSNQEILIFKPWFPDLDLIIYEFALKTSLQNVHIIYEFALKTSLQNMHIIHEFGLKTSLQNMHNYLKIFFINFLARYALLFKNLLLKLPCKMCIIIYEFALKPSSFLV